MAKFTPGPWAAIRPGLHCGEFASCWEILPAAGPTAAYVPNHCADIALANAALIAAAPALYEALEAIAPWLRNGDYDTRGGLIEMDRLASVAESALATARQGE